MYTCMPPLILSNQADRETSLLRHLGYFAEGSRVLVFCSSKKTVEGAWRAIELVT